MQNDNMKIVIDTDTLNPGFEERALRLAIREEFYAEVVDLEIKSTGRGTEMLGFEQAEDARARLRAVLESADF